MTLSDQPDMGHLEPEPNSGAIMCISRGVETPTPLHRHVA